MNLLRKICIFLSCFAGLVACGGPTDTRELETAVTAPAAVADHGVAGAEAHTKSAESMTQTLLPSATPVQSPVLNSISTEHRFTLGELATVKTALAAALDGFQRFAANAAAWEAKYQELLGKWYVRWGRRIEAFIIWAAAVWLIAGVLAIAAGLSPWAWAVKFGQFILHVIPLANPFVWVRDFAGLFKSKKIAPPL